MNDLINGINSDILIYDFFEVQENMSEIIKLILNIDSKIIKVESNFIGCNDSNISINNNIFKLNLKIKFRLEYLNNIELFKVQNFSYNTSIYIKEDKNKIKYYTPLIVYNYEKIFKNNKLYFAIIIRNRERLN